MLDFCPGAYGGVVRKPIPSESAMKTFITALAIVFVLATATSVIALTVYGDHAHIDQGRHTAQKTALLY